MFSDFSLESFFSYFSPNFIPDFEVRLILNAIYYKTLFK